MFIKNLKVSTSSKIIRNMNFQTGLNLIIDDTPTDDQKQTGNNVGKTTVLKLISYCLGGDGKEIYTDSENKKDVYREVKDFLINEEVLITLTLVEDLNKRNSKTIVIERDFLAGKNSIRRINGEQVLQKEFEQELKKILFPNLENDKPSLRQLISHNIRYKDESINNTLKTLNRYTKDVEYETLYLYLLGCTFKDADEKQSISAKLSQEKNYKDRLESKQTKNSYEIALDLIENEIDELNRTKASFNINKNFESDLNKLNRVRYEITKNSSFISKLTIRRDIILDAKKEMEQNITNMDIKQIKILYSEAKHNLEEITKTFDELVEYHNKMIIEKIKFITKELPDIESQICKTEEILNNNLKIEKELIKRVSKSDSFNELNKVISILTEKYRQKGEYESIISQINEVSDNIDKLEAKLSEIDNILYSDVFEENLKKQLSKFNKYFSEISNELYGEKYALKFEK